VVSEELIQYTSQARANGQSNATIRAALISAGWAVEDINSVLGEKTDAQMPVFSSGVTKSLQQRRFKMIGIVLMSLGCLAIIGSGVWAYMMFVNPDPKAVLTDMFDEVQKVKSFAYVSTVEIYGPEVKTEDTATSSDAFSFFEVSQPTEPLHVDVETEGMLDLHNSEDPLFSGSVRLLIENSGLFDLSTTIETVVAGRTLFLRLVKAPAILFFDLSGLEGKWIAIEEKEVKEGAEGQGVDTELTQEQKNRIYELITQFTFIASIDEMGIEEISGVEAYHYHLTLDLDELDRVSHEVERIIRPDTQQPSTVTSSPAGEAIIDALDLWVGKKDHLPYKIEIAERMVKDGEVILRAVAKSTASRYNEQFAISAPADAKPLDDILEEYFKNQGSGTQLFQREMEFREFVAQKVIQPAGLLTKLIVTEKSKDNGGFFAGLYLLMNELR